MSTAAANTLTRTSAHHLLRTHIERHGPMPLGRFLEYVLYDPTVGFYREQHLDSGLPNGAQELLGQRGHFITAPEISQIFGETIAVAILDMWQKMGCPTPIVITECGGGNGTLMTDILRVCAQHPTFINAVTVCCIEISSLLRQRQRQAITALYHRYRLRQDLENFLIFPTTITNLPPAACYFFVANEYYDALPIDQYLIHTQDVQPRHVSYCPNRDIFFLADPGACAAIIEYCPGMMNHLMAIRRYLESAVGGAILIDYGYNQPPVICDTLQTIWRHQKIHPFDLLGEADISHHVDFNAIMWVLSGLLDAHINTASPPDPTLLERLQQPFPATAVLPSNALLRLQTQAQFLSSYGITQRLQFLCERNPSEAQQLAQGVARLTSPSLMGSLFKAVSYARYS